MSYASYNGVAGTQQVAPYGLPDTTARIKTGTILDYYDNYWGGLEVVYGYAAGNIRQFGLCVITPTFTGGAWRTEMSEVPNTANLGRTLCVAMTTMTTGEFGWFAIAGIIPVNSTSSITADTAVGIVAAGQAGTLASGKQILNGRVIAAATTTVVKLGNANAGAKLLTVSSADGWFVGCYLSGTGIAAATVVVDIDPSGTQVTLNNSTTAQVNSNVTGTYNNATVFYNVAYINRPTAQGQIT